MKNIKVFSDYVCPFCYIGFALVKKLKEEFPDLEVSFYPFILNPSLPLEGADLRDSLDEDRINQGFKMIEMMGQQHGLVFKNKYRQFNTQRLHQASLYARDKGKIFEFSELAFKYIYEYGKNVADPLIINELALALELDSLEMNKKIDRGDYDQEMAGALELRKSMGISSVPTFIVNDDKRLVGVKDYEALKEALLG